MIPADFFKGLTKITTDLEPLFEFVASFVMT